MEGWIKSYRSVMENPAVCKDADHFAIWGYLLHYATHAPKPDFFNGKKIILKPGQLITGRQKIALKFNINEHKVDRVLKLFETEQQIEQQTSNRSRLISILNWGIYQGSEQQIEQQMSNKCTTDEQQMSTIQECKNKKNEITHTHSLNNSFQVKTLTRARGMLDWIEKNFPDFLSMEFPLKESQAESITARLQDEDISRILIDMYNKGVHERCRSVFQSFLRYEQTDLILKEQKKQSNDKIYRR